jgi:hypothetical protein
MYLAPVIAAFLVSSQGTDTTLADVLAGRAAPLEVAAATLPADYVAVEMQTAGATGGIDSLLSSPFMMLGMMMGAEQTSGPPPEAMAVLTAVWTKGQILRVDGQSFYVTYGFALSSAASAEPPTNLQLKLIRVDSVTAIRPLGKISADLSKLKPSGTVVTAPPPAAAPSLVEEHGGGMFELTGPTPVFLSPVEAVSGSGRASRHAAMKALLLRTEIMLAESKNVFPYVQSTASMYGVVAGARATAMPPMDFYRLAACPRDGVRFLFNMSLAGVDAATLPNGASLPVWYEEDPDLDGNRVVGLMNGSTRLVNTAEWSANYTTLLRKTYRKAPGRQPLPADYAVNGVPAWLR